MPAAARATDTHTCPMTNPNGSPHTGGPITLNCSLDVMIGNQFAAVVGSVCTCAGPPDSVKLGSQTVLINGKGAARQGDTTQHNGSITSGFATVIIGG